MVVIAISLIGIVENEKSRLLDEIHLKIKNKNLSFITISYAKQSIGQGVFVLNNFLCNSTQIFYDIEGIVKYLENI